MLDAKLIEKAHPRLANFLVGDLSIGPQRNKIRCHIKETTTMDATNS
jgi:hypothetical protein